MKYDIPIDDKYSFDELPDFNQFVQDIKAFDSIDFNGKDIFDITELYFKHVKILPMTIFTGSIHKKNFFRIRPDKTIGKDEDLTLIKTFSYPPAKVSPWGRANLKYHSVFYCCDSYITTFYESRMEVGDTGYLSWWYCDSDELIDYNCFLPFNLTKENRWSNHIGSIYQDMSKIERSHDKSLHELYLNIYLAEKFVFESHPYPITSFISHAALDNDYPADCIIYPSVQTKLNKCNIAFNPTSADKYLMLKKVIRFKVIEKDDFNVNFRMELIGDNINGTLKYREPTDADWNEFKK